LLYYFEDVSLREAAFGYDQDIQALIANPRKAGEPVTRLFAKATLRAVHALNFKSETVADDVIQVHASDRLRNAPTRRMHGLLRIGESFLVLQLAAIRDRSRGTARRNRVSR
jgi:hypothetical protein